MNITVTINSCRDCKYLDHSGSFTPGGAKLICGHRDAIPSRRSVGDDNYHWKYRVIEDANKVWDRCPLMKGSEY